MIRVQDAVTNLRPGCEWSMTDDDVASIVWHTDGVEPVTQAEVDAEMARLQAAAAQAESDRVKAIQDAQAEAKAMGFSDGAVATITGYPYPYSPTV